MQMHHAQVGKKRRKLTDAEKFAHRVARKCEVLAPQLPEIDRHDLELIVIEQLKTIKERMQVMFLKPGANGHSSFDETLLLKLRRALQQVGLRASFRAGVANKQAEVVTKKKIELFVHEQAQLQSKMKKFARAFGVAPLPSPEASSRIVRMTGRTVTIGFILAV